MNRAVAACLHHPSIRSALPTMIVYSNSQTLLGGRAPIQTIGLTFGHRTSRATLHTSDTIRLLCSPYPIQPYCQFPRHHHLGHSTVLSVLQPLVGAFQFWYQAGRALSRFHQQTAQHRIALLADTTQPLPSTTGMLRRIQPQITDYLPTVGETLDLSQSE